jgi:hypothetical protein
LECRSPKADCQGTDRAGFPLKPVIIEKLRAHAEAKAAYQEFLPPWKDADPDPDPHLKEAEAEYVKRALSSALTRRVKVPLAPK